ncbi:MAG: PEP-CTERM sorting domain-containing protein [Akkermansiaceae bacterium]|nr:PEP-CTERM sorting domain-containing protein [Akkermansiaceae bacterium]
MVAGFFQFPAYGFNGTFNVAVCGGVCVAEPVACALQEVVQVLRAVGKVAVEGDVLRAHGASVKYLSFVATAPIPEPTTATLSLLALAGLAARRRRASR